MATGFTQTEILFTKGSVAQLKAFLCAAFLIFALPVQAAKDPCRGFLALQTAQAALNAGTLTPDRLARLLAKVDPADFAQADQPVVKALFYSDPVSVQAFAVWSKIGTPYLSVRLSHCRRPDPATPVKGAVEDPRPGNADQQEGPGASVEDNRPFDREVIVLAAAGGAGMLGLGFALLGPVARHLRRRRRRYLCALDVYLSSASGSGDGQVLDISLVGAKVRKGEFPAEVGDRVQLSTDAFHATAYVIWCNAHYLGVKFRQPLNMDQVKRAIATRPKRARDVSKVGAALEA